MKEIEEGPEERDEEAGDNNEEEPVIVSDAICSNLKVSSSVETDPRGWSCARHANDPQYLNINKNSEAHIKL